jgi:hypothetical protein
VQALFELIFTSIFVFSWLALPSVSRAMLAPLTDVFRLSPVVHEYYVPILLLGLATIAQQCVTLARPQWSWVRPAVLLITNGIGLVMLVSLLTTPGPYISLAHPATDFSRYGQALGIVNTVFFFSMVAMALGSLISVIVYGFKLFRELRRLDDPGGSAAVLRFL